MKIRTLAPLLLALALPLVAQSLHAQTLSGIKVEPATAKPGESVTITVAFDKSEAINCGVRVHFGDGQNEKVRINKAEMVPLVIQRSYAKPGQYKLEAEPTGVGHVLKCAGQRMSTMLTVAAPAAPTGKAAPASLTAAGSVCPSGWKPLGKAHAKTKAFTCTAKAGTAIPEPRLVCPGELTYFENSKKGQLGCRM